MEVLHQKFKSAMLTEGSTIMTLEPTEKRLRNRFATLQKELEELNYSKIGIDLYWKFSQLASRWKLPSAPVELLPPLRYWMLPVVLQLPRTVSVPASGLDLAKGVATSQAPPANTLVPQGRHAEAVFSPTANIFVRDFVIRRIPSLPSATGSQVHLITSRLASQHRRVTASSAVSSPLSSTCHPGVADEVELLENKKIDLEAKFVKLYSLCPIEWNRPRKRLCVILITENNKKHEFARVALRDIALNSGYNSKRVQFAYMFKETQPNFVQSISKGSFEKSLLQIVIIWRRNNKHIKYEWVFVAKRNDTVVAGNLTNSTENDISYTLKRLLKSSEGFKYESIVQKLFDEHSKGLLSKWISRFRYLVDYVSDNIEEEHLLVCLSLLGTIGFMFAVGYILTYFVNAEVENLKAQGHLNESQDECQNNYIPELKLYELRAEKYNGMIRLLKPGCRTILLITDFKSRNRLIPYFHKAIWPYRKSKTLLFGHMVIERGLTWFTEILRLSLCTNQKLEVNPRNCVGTVLALNGHRKYFCMYHAKHPESVRGPKRILKITKILLDPTEDPEVGTFLERGYSEESEAESNILLEENLLNSLDNWLERLFDGRTQKYYINYWPEFTTK
ncbi:dnaJ homolog subfamily C member 16 [Drosophila eugracilis]|uniref:dnaJ homolog subfamily C member 16 n=1 Tax=Drosophila eugracilis TaxID=29029 RepID=UPI001BD99EFE|nr:dnaJ homolog subfamily C member 16 [Drosophila eugracilis]